MSAPSIIRCSSLARQYSQRRFPTYMDGRERSIAQDSFSEVTLEKTGAIVDRTRSTLEKSVSLIDFFSPSHSLETEHIWSSAGHHRRLRLPVRLKTSNGELCAWNSSREDNAKLWQRQHKHRVFTPASLSSRESSQWSGVTSFPR
jgi:hypothetical protein